MSATAFAITEPKIVLLSDGMTTKDGEIHDTDWSKIHKINSRVALLWMGVGAHACAVSLKDRIRIGGHTEPEQIATEAGKVLKSFYKDSGNEYILQTDRFWVTTLGYNREGTPVGYQLDSKEDYRYKPKQAPIRAGMIGSLVKGFEYNQSPFSKLLATKYLPLYQDLEYAAKMAFAETVEQCKQNMVGGEQFFETLTPQ